ncbi:MAG TPA: TIM-barrel domain-containing protein [Candidatus Limnocylindrales bacterium]|nr:TIM-barrel domain-containing protein [Candidatus Limnocylindrales bacterium]
MKKVRLFRCAPLGLLRLALLTLAVAISAGAVRAATNPPGKYDPVADPRAVVTVGHARFTILTPQLIRMEWAADGKFEDHASLVFLNRKLPVPKFDRLIRTSGGITVLDLRTGDLSLRYTGGNDNGKFDAENLSITLTLDGKQITWHPGMEDKGNLLGTARTLDGVKGSNTKLEPGLVSRDGWVVVDDSTRPLFDSDDFSFTEGEKSPWPWVMERPAGDRQDLYFFGYGHDYRQALYDFTRVSGKIPLPPQFAFGVWWSRYWSYTDQELEQLVRQFQAYAVPLDVLVIDMDWHPTFGMHWWDKRVDASGHNLGWTGYSWNKNLFPDPTAFLTWVHQQGLKATLNMHPASGIQPWETRYPEMARAMGIDPATKQYVKFDIANKKFATNYMDIMHHALEREGIDFFWLDWQQEPTTSVPGVNPTWWLNYVHFTDQEREGKRALLFHRWGGLGNHRYEIGFSGDTISVWDSLAFQPYFTATAANVGYAYWSHDIGGHMPGTIDPELFLRWIQFGTFSPILRTHTTKNPDAERRIWAYPEPYSDLMRQSFLLRYALQPYIYTEARRTYDTGIAVVHPLYYDSPEAPEAYVDNDEYMFGDEMLVAPIVQAVAKDSQIAKRSVWLPKGDWIEWYKGTHLKGPASFDRSFSIGQVPVYVKAGSIVPMQPQMEYTREKPLDPLILTVFPSEDGRASSYRLYQDAGDTPGYKTGQDAWTKIRAASSESGATLSLAVSPIEGSYRGMQASRAYEVRLPGNWPPASVTVNGQAIPHGSKGQSWSYDGNTLTTTIRTRTFPVSTGVNIVVKIKPELARQTSLLDGFAGKIARLRETYDILNRAWPEGWSPDQLIEAMQTGDRISYHPKTAFEELSKFPNRLIGLRKQIEAMHDVENSEEFRTAVKANRFGQPGPGEGDVVTHFHRIVDQGLAHVSDVAPPR